MSEGAISPSIFHFLEKHVGRRVMVVVERDLGYEGRIEAVSHTPPGIWLSDVEAVVIRTTIANPVPRVASKEKKSELFLHLNSALRIEILPSKEERKD